VNTLPKWYVEGRREVEKYFTAANLIKGETDKSISPCMKYEIRIERYRTVAGGWDYTRGIVWDRSKHLKIADIKRSGPDFWYCWVQQRDRRILLCSEDPQGYTVVDLTYNEQHTYIDPKARSGLGFVWNHVVPSPDGERVAVLGTIYDAAKMCILYDLTKPDILPLPMLRSLDSEINNYATRIKWTDNDTLEIELLQSNEVKKVITVCV